MGGIGSGARRSTHVGDVDGALAPDIRALRRLGVVRVGECVINTVHRSRGDPAAPSARLRVDLSDVERGGTLTITGKMADGTINQNIAIEALPSSFGGHRCYFRCPVTADRCEVLYYARGRFASRNAQRLSYAVQGMTDLSRARRKTAKLHRRLYEVAPLARPRGRNREKMQERLRDARMIAKALYLDRLRNLADRSGARSGPGASH